MPAVRTARTEAWSRGPAHTWPPTGQALRCAVDRGGAYQATTWRSRPSRPGTRALNSAITPVFPRSAPVTPADCFPERPDAVPGVHRRLSRPPKGDVPGPDIITRNAVHCTLAQVGRPGWSELVSAVRMPDCALSEPLEGGPE